MAAALPCLIGLALLATTRKATETRFLSGKETARVIREDKDHYVKNLTFSDLIARNLTSHKDYMRKAGTACADFTQSEKARLTSLAKAIDARLSAFDRGNLSKIPWAFAKTRGDILENGLPYTRGNIIFLPTPVLNDPERLPGTLAHEKVHVYQRLYPRETQAYLRSMGYRPIKRKVDPLLRSNPDEDQWVYAQDGQQVGHYYNSSRPKSLSDISGRSHPFEVMARQVERQFQKAS